MRFCSCVGDGRGEVDEMSTRTVFMRLRAAARGRCPQLRGQQQVSHLSNQRVSAEVPGVRGKKWRDGERRVRMDD